MEAHRAIHTQPLQAMTQTVQSQTRPISFTVVNLMVCPPDESSHAAQAVEFNHN